MTEIKTIAPPSIKDGVGTIIRPEDANPDMANAAMLRALLARWPVPAISTRKFTVIHGLMLALNHSEKNPTYIDTSALVSLMDSVEYKSVNVDGSLFHNLFAYLMHPVYTIMGMPQGGPEVKKPGLISSLWGKLTGAPQQPQAAGETK